MKLLALIRLSLKIGIGCFVAMTLAMIGWTFAWPEPDVRLMAKADVIVCLGGGMNAEGVLDPPVLTRIERCVQLYEAEIAPVIIFSGGTAAPDGPSAGEQMHLYAQTLGLPAEHGVVEPRAQSTLQNAIFSLELAIGAQDFIIVTEAFHLPRSWASFHWARWDMGLPNSKTFRLVMSEGVRSNADNTGPNWNMLARESLAIWFNVARAAAYSAAPDPSLDWLH